MAFVRLALTWLKDPKGHMRTAIKTEMGLEIEATYRLQGKTLQWLVKQFTERGDLVKVAGYAETEDRAKAFVRQSVEALLNLYEPAQGYAPEPTWTSNPFRGYEMTMREKGYGFNWAVRKVDLPDGEENPVRANGYAESMDEAHRASWAVVKELLFGEVTPDAPAKK